MKHQQTKGHNSINAALYAELLEEYGDKLLRLAFVIIGDLQLSEDVVQESFLALHKNIDGLRGDSSYYTWLYRVTVNKSKNIVRRQRLKRIFFTEDIQAPTPSASPEEMLMATEEQENVRAALYLLPLKYREVLYLYYFEELKIKIIAKIMDITEAGIKTRLQRGREHLKKILLEGRV